MNPQTARASHALRQVGRDTASPATRDSAAFAADQAQFERYLTRNPRPHGLERHRALKRVAPNQVRGIKIIRPSMAKAHRARHGR